MMKYIILLSAVVASALSAVVPEAMTTQLDGRIVGGSAASIGNFPYVVSVQRNGLHSCGGVIYSSTYIITAAHCLQAVTASELKVRAGSADWKKGGTLSSVISFKNHELYNPTTMVYDIAVIRVNNLPLNNIDIKAISLSYSQPSDESYGLIAGWGNTKYGSNNFSSTLQSVYVSTISRTQCASRDYGYEKKQIKETMFCAASPGKDACQFDSGGPLAVNNVLIGIISWGIGCANPYYPGVYTDISKVRSWIINNTG